MQFGEMQLSLTSIFPLLLKGGALKLRAVHAGNRNKKKKKKKKKKIKKKKKKKYF